MDRYDREEVLKAVFKVKPLLSVYKNDAKLFAAVSVSRELFFMSFSRTTSHDAFWSFTISEKI